VDRNVENGFSGEALTQQQRAGDFIYVFVEKGVDVKINFIKYPATVLERPCMSNDRLSMECTEKTDGQFLPVQFSHWLLDWKW